MKRSGLLTLFFMLVLSVGSLRGQVFDTEYYPADERDAREEPSDDDLIFNVPAWESADPFRGLSRYGFTSVRYRERGLEPNRRKVYFEGFDLSDELSGRPDYELLRLLPKTPLARSYLPAMVAGSGYLGGAGSSESYFADARASGNVSRVSLRGGDRGHRLAFDTNGRLPLGKKWNGTGTITGRWGPDGHIKGVGSNGAGVLFSVSGGLWKDATLTLAAAGEISRSGLRTAAADEAFALTDDAMYNPSWGYQNGRARNSRMRNTASTLFTARLETPLGEGRKLTAGATARLARRGQTFLAWYGTHSPMPDYYRVMPSYFPDWSVVETIAEAWREGDPTVTQLNWDDLILNNSLESGGHAIYIVEERVERSTGLHFNLRIDRAIGGGLNVSYGLRVRSGRSRNFKEAADLLGAGHILNIDQYATDGEEGYYPGAPSENDLRTPGRRVGEGERFGYDYALTLIEPSAFGIVRWNRIRYGLTVSGSLARTVLRRRGYYEKGLFPGSESFGRSPAEGFTTGSVNASAWWNVSIRQRLSLSALASNEAPTADAVFISPRQHNHTIANPTAPQVYGAEVSWSLAGKSVDLRLTGFVNSATGETEIRSYYDDLASEFSNMIVRGIDKLCYGIEAGIEARLSRTLSLRAGGSAATYRYNSEPSATVLADRDGAVISEGIVCYLSGLRLGPPQFTAAAEMAYSGFSYLRASISCEWAGGRHVAINPLYHSSRVAGINSAPEIMALFSSQERLPDAFTVGASISKGFVFKNGYLRLAASVRNLLSSRIVYSGYEQMRIMRQGSGINRTYAPFPTKYLYAYPLTWSFTLSYSL